MERVDFTVTDPIGLHARPAAVLVKTAARLHVARAAGTWGKTADARSIFQLLGLGVRQGSVVTVTAEGADETEALAAVLEVLRSGRSRSSTKKKLINIPKTRSRKPCGYARRRMPT